MSWLDIELIRLQDILTDTEVNLITGDEKPGLGLPRSNVLKYYFEKGGWIALRPSGTEPKIKFYFSLRHVVEGDLLEAKQEGSSNHG